MSVRDSLAIGLTQTFGLVSRVGITAATAYGSWEGFTMVRDSMNSGPMVGPGQAVGAVVACGALGFIFSGLAWKYGALPGQYLTSKLFDKVWPRTTLPVKSPAGAAFAASDAPAAQPAAPQQPPVQP